MGHKSPEHKTLVEPDSGITKKHSQKKNAPKMLCHSKLDGNLLNLYNNDDMSDGQFFANLGNDDAFGFDNWWSAPVELEKCTDNCTALENVLYKTEISNNLSEIKKSDTFFDTKSTSCN